MRIIEQAVIQAHYHEADALEKLKEGFRAFSAGRVQLPPAQQFLFAQAVGDCCI